MNTAEKHGWNDLEDYLRVMLRVVEDDPFVVGHTLQITGISPEAGEISGDIFCHGDVVIDVRKNFEIRTTRSRKEARTVRYSYHARYGNDNPILRYDNAHRHPGHPTFHHKHDWLSGTEETNHVGRGWPHLSEVLDELKKRIWK